MTIYYIEVTLDAFFFLYNAERAEYNLPPILENEREDVLRLMSRNVVIGKDSLMAACSDRDLQLLDAGGHQYNIIETTDDQEGDETL